MMMAQLLNLNDVTRIASAAAHEQSPDLDVVGVMHGGGDYVEVLLNIHGCRREPCQMSLGVFRNQPELALHADISEQLRRHVEAYKH